MTFDMKVRFDTGRKLAISFGSRPDLLSRGVTIACFCDAGSRPCISDVLTSVVRNGSSRSTDSRTRNVGTGSSMHDLSGDCRYFSYSLARYYRYSRYCRYSLAVRRLRSVERQLRHSDARQLTLEDSNAELRRQLTDAELTSDQLMTSVHQLTSELDDALQKLQVTRTTGMIDLRIDRESGFYEFKKN